MVIFPEAKILEIDLTSGTINRKTLPGEIYRLYPGGSALGLYLMMQDYIPGTEALDPGNVLVFSVSPLTGLPISGISRMNVTARSPLTGTAGDSQSGGFIASYLKMNGWDAIVFKGKSQKPVYLVIDGNKAELKDASHLWGKVTGEVESSLQDELGDKNIEVAQIGPAGENLVKYACIINKCSRANGRNGMGAVMGSKNLKAMVVKKGRPMVAADTEAFMALARSSRKRLEENEGVAGLGLNGTDGDLEGFSDSGFLPTRNWKTGYFPEGATNITGTTMYETVLKERDTCYACAVRCKRVVEIPGRVDPVYGGPEYETCAALGSYCGVTDLAEVCEANMLCNMYGMDTISCGATISFAMECFEEGLLTSEQAEGLDLKFGNGAAVNALIKKIALREGLGDLLAEGSARASEKIGGGSEKFSMSVKKQEMPAHMPQYKPAVGLVYAVNPFGADHQSSEHDVFLVMPPDSRERERLSKLGIWKGYDNPYELDAEKVRFALDTQKYFSVLDSLSLCQFVWGPSWELYGPDELLELCRAGLGWETSLYELMMAGERRINMMRQFNAREGFTAADDTLPARLFEPFTDGPAKGIHVDRDAFEAGKKLYYEMAGWDPQTGNPTAATLKKLSLDWLL
ncbi:aldehyde ferredoxin oxidoreductase family protein [Acidaminobacter sp.]|uniref:aldehyde ferredoxin oxidoreductase family protein n=1 Tax=Acidaminobacter sp. TaxID=1872102 RepID=UPI00256B46FF|nr:aldehyde ferredoxin oxidoreductase family protein [Acidaminobacter sp.]MDK9709902.1 aldehyde ferredoxin oxidoreductase family protein [Acidaminobacter sp.]